MDDYELDTYSPKAALIIRDTIRQEKDFEINYTLRGKFYDHYGIIWTRYAIRLTIIILVALSGFTVITTGIWALVQCTMLFPSITTQAYLSLFILSVLAIIVGVLMIALVVGFELFLKCERASKSDLLRSSFIEMAIILLISLFVILTALGIAAGSLIPSLSANVETSANNALFTVVDSQEAREAWDTAQNTLKCCGVESFTDYKKIFNNFSVPVSCCDTTNPLANETTCPDIVKDTSVANINELIYTEGCVSKFVTFYHYILSVVAGVSITIGGLPVCVGLYLLSLIGFSIFEKYCFSGCSDNGMYMMYMYMYDTIILLALLLGLFYISAGIGGLVQINSFYYPIIGTSVVTALFPVFLVFGIIMCCTTVRGVYQQSTEPRCTVDGVCIVPATMVLTLVLVIIAAVMSRPTSSELSNTLHKYLNNENIRENWNDLQENMKCCGVSNFTDYETVFNNFSVPVSCCNTASPLASECPDIVRNSQQKINQIGLIYTEGCLSHMESLFNSLFAMPQAVGFAIGFMLAAVLLMLSSGLLLLGILKCAND